MVGQRLPPKCPTSIRLVEGIGCKRSACLLQAWLVTKRKMPSPHPTLLFFSRNHLVKVALSPSHKEDFLPAAPCPRAGLLPSCKPALGDCTEKYLRQPDKICSSQAGCVLPAEPACLPVPLFP